MQVRQIPFRLLRATVFAAVTVSASALLHIWGGGAAPRPEFFAAGLALVFAGGVAAGGRQRGFAALAPLCLAAQWGLHECFSAGAAPHDHGAGVSMLLVHVVAALAQASWLARGEAGLAALLDLLTLFLARAVRPRLARARVPVFRRAFRPRTRRLRSLEPLATAISNRGPPVFAL
ncbi:hypothetical protein [Glycomyces tenuis]|uniref:hypothetical protein n=1 Tax=Glycomyces tenuis TaxID=58116 RepID=UPI00040E1A1F|nr:hypothetical protein [Glycomyces tenuis]